MNDLLAMVAAHGTHNFNKIVGTSMKHNDTTDFSKSFAVTRKISTLFETETEIGDVPTAGHYSKGGLPPTGRRIIQWTMTYSAIRFGFYQAIHKDDLEDARDGGAVAMAEMLWNRMGETIYKGKQVLTVAALLYARNNTTPPLGLQPYVGLTTADKTSGTYNRMFHPVHTWRTSDVTFQNVPDANQTLSELANNTADAIAETMRLDQNWPTNFGAKKLLIARNLKSQAFMLRDTEKTPTTNNNAMNQYKYNLEDTDPTIIPLFPSNRFIWKVSTDPAYMIQWVMRSPVTPVNDEQKMRGFLEYSMQGRCRAQQGKTAFGFIDCLAAPS